MTSSEESDIEEPVSPHHVLDRLAEPVGVEDIEFSTEWIAELERRAFALDSGDDPGILWEGALADARRRLE